MLLPRSISLRGCFGSNFCRAAAQAPLCCYRRSHNGFVHGKLDILCFIGALFIDLFIFPINVSCSSSSNGRVTTTILHFFHKCCFLLVFIYSLWRKGGNPLVLSFQKCFIHWCETHRSKHVYNGKKCKATDRQYCAGESFVLYGRYRTWVTNPRKQTECSQLSSDAWTPNISIL